eukprot:3189499-Prymnesium_polylepis.1
MPEALSGRDEDGNSPLHLTSQRGLDSATRMLLAAGAVVNLENARGQTPAALAEAFGHAELAATLAAAAVGTGHTGGASAESAAGGGSSATGLSSSAAPPPSANGLVEPPCALKPKALPPLGPPGSPGVSAGFGAPLGPALGAVLGPPGGLAPL